MLRVHRARLELMAYRPRKQVSIVRIELIYHLQYGGEKCLRGQASIAAYVATTFLILGSH